LTWILGRHAFLELFLSYDPDSELAVSIFIFYGCKNMQVTPDATDIAIQQKRLTKKVKEFRTG
jgi:hypothetical protein